MSPFIFDYGLFKCIGSNWAYSNDWTKCSGIGTGGTISGIGETLKAQNPDIEIWAVEPENAAILAGGTIGTHLQMGIGDGIKLAQKLEKGKTVVTVLPDTAERYFSTPLFEGD